MLARRGSRLGPAPELLAIAAGAWLAAGVLSTALGALVLPPPAPHLVASTPLPRPPTRFQAHELGDRLAPLLGMAPEATPTAGDPAARASCDDPSARPVKSGSRVTLVAGVLASPPERSLASLFDGATTETYLLAVGEQRAALRLLAVQADSLEAGAEAFGLVAVICNEGRKEYVDMRTSAESPAPVLPAPADTRPRARPVGPDRFEIDARTLDAVLSADVMLDARVVPSFAEGRATGFRVLSIRAGSFLSSLGVENGDVIRAIDGHEVTSVERALELYQRLREARHVTLELDRGGRALRRDYAIVGR
jgi:general secretion pathway protein C